MMLFGKGELYVKVSKLGESFRKFGDVLGVSLSVSAGKDVAMTSMPSVSGDPGYGYGGSAMLMTPEDRLIELMKESQRTQNFMSINELRHQAGLEPIPGGYGDVTPFSVTDNQKLPEIPVISNRKRAVAVRKVLP